MTDGKRAKITLNFSNGEPITHWEQVTISERFDDALGSYSFEVRPLIEAESGSKNSLRYYQERIMKGELVAILVDGRPYATPMIDTVTSTIDRQGGVTMKVECKSVLAVAAEASADPTIYEKQKTDVPIDALILQVMWPFGFDEIVADEAGHTETLTGKPISGKAPAITATELKAKDAQVQDNETAYGYCARLFSRLGVALRVNHAGQLLLSAPDYEQSPLYRIFETTGEGNRTISMTVSETNRGQFSRVVIRGRSEEKRRKKQTAKPRAGLRQEKLTGRFASSKKEAFAQASYTALATDSPYNEVPHETFSSDVPLYTSSVQPYKPKFYVDKRSRDNEKCASFCKLVYTKNAPTAFEVTAELDGLKSRNGAVWAINTICRVQAPTFGFDRDMWVHQVTLTQNRRGSERATLKLIPKYSLVLGDIPG